MRPKVNFIIDTNLMFYKFAYVHAYKNTNYLSKPSHRAQLVRDVTKNIEQQVNNFAGHVDRVIFVADCKDKNWRKDIEVEDEFYKSERNKDYPFDIKAFQNTLNGYIRLLREVGIYTYQYSRMEGDDLMFMISNILFHNGLSSIIATSDVDMHQLIRRDPSGKFIYVYDPDAQKRCFYVPEPQEYIQPSNSDAYNGIFSISSPETIAYADYNHIQDIIYRESKIIDPHAILFIKILSGDKSDSVPSSYVYLKGVNEKKGKTGTPTNFTDKRAADLLQKYQAADLILTDQTHPENTQQVYKESQLMYPGADFVKRLRTDLEYAQTIAKDMIEEVRVKADKGKPYDSDVVAKIVVNLIRNCQFIHLGKDSYEGEMLEKYKEVKLHIGKDLSNKEFLMQHMAMFSDGWPKDIFSGTDFDIQEDENITIDFRDL
jgi:5'-3' exonuclease